MFGTPGLVNRFLPAQQGHTAGAVHRFDADYADSTLIYAISPPGISGKDFTPLSLESRAHIGNHEIVLLAKILWEVPVLPYVVIVSTYGN